MYISYLSVCVCVQYMYHNAEIVVKEVLLHYLGAGAPYRVNTTVQYRAM